MEERHRGARLDERRRPRSARSEKLHAIVNKIGYPDKWRDYGAVHDRSAATSSATSSARTRFESQRAARQDRQARRPRRVGDDAADRQRLLQPADERHQLPGRRAAAAALRPEDGRRAELRQHRRHHRPRADARLRRRGPPVRRARATCKDWWTTADGKAFEERAQCIVDQYAQYTIVDDIKINSKLTSGEDVADLGGLILAWMAWKDGDRGQEAGDRATASRPSSASSSASRSGPARTSGRRTCA